MVYRILGYKCDRVVVLAVLDHLELALTYLKRYRNSKKFYHVEIEASRVKKRRE